MNRFARFSILGVSILVFGWVGLGHVLGRTTDNKAYKSLVVYSEVLQKIQQDYVDEPNLHLVEAGSLHGLLESLDSESSYFTPREYTEYKQKIANPSGGETGLNLSKRFGYIIVTSVLPDSPAETFLSPWQDSPHGRCPPGRRKISWPGSRERESRLESSAVVRPIPR